MDITEEEQEILNDFGWNETSGFRRYFLFLLLAIALGFSISVLCHLLLEFPESQQYLMTLIISVCVFGIFIGFDYSYMKLYNKHEVYMSVSKAVIRRNWGKFNLNKVMLSEEQGLKGK